MKISTLDLTNEQLEGFKSGKTFDELGLDPRQWGALSMLLGCYKGDSMGFKTWLLSEW